MIITTIQRYWPVKLQSVQNRFTRVDRSILKYYYELAFCYQIDLFFDKFVIAFSSCFNKYAPLKRASRKKRKLMFKPWITKGIFISIRQERIVCVTHYLRDNEIQKKYQQSLCKQIDQTQNFFQKVVFQILNFKFEA